MRVSRERSWHKKNEKARFSGQCDVVHLNATQPSHCLFRHHPKKENRGYSTSVPRTAATTRARRKTKPGKTELAQGKLCRDYLNWVCRRPVPHNNRGCGHGDWLVDQTVLTKTRNSVLLSSVPGTPLQLQHNDTLLSRHRQMELNGTPSLVYVKSILNLCDRGMVVLANSRQIM